MRKFPFRLSILQLVSVALLLLLGMVSISACSAFANPLSLTQELPTLQAIIPFENPYLIPEYVSVIPGGYAYVVEEHGAIIILDGTEQVAVIPPLSGERSFGYHQAVVIHPETRVGYLANSHTDNLYIIHGTELITTVRNIGDAPHSVSINPTTGLIYIANSLDPLGITILKGTEVITRLATTFPKVITADPNSAKVYVGQDIVRSSPSKAQGLLAVIDETKLITLTNLGYEQEKPDADGDINNIAIDRNSGEIYMIRNLSTIVYLAKGRSKILKLGGMGYTGLHDIAIDPNRGLAYVSSWGNPQSHVVVLSHGELLTALPTGQDPRAIVYDKTHDYVYVVNRLSHSLSVIRNTEVITTIEARGNPWDIGVDETRGYIYLANPDSHNITVFGFASEIKARSFWDFLPFVNK